MREFDRRSDMDPEFLRQLEARRDQVAAAKAKTEAQLANLTDTLQKLDEAIGVLLNPTLLSGRRSGNESHSHSKRNTGALSPREVGEHAKRLLLEVGRPMKRGVLLREFDRHGVKIAGGDRAKVLGTILWRLKDRSGAPLFVNTDDGYWPADTALPG